jgi:hypothetical protein
MSSLKSYFRKKHKYETQADLKDMTAEQIININPNEVGYYLDEETGGIPLEGVKRRAMFTLLALKRAQKTRPNERARQSSINNFLVRENIKSDPEVDSLISNAQDELVKEHIVKMREQLGTKDLTNRLRKLRDQQPIPDTEEEATFRRLDVLRAGKRKTRKTRKSRRSFGKNISKRNRREKTKKGRKRTKASVKTQRRK